jgi:single-stranded DNA-binding protein
MNVVNLTGVLAHNPTLRYREDRPAVMLEVATFTYKKDSDGKWRTVPTTIPVFVGEKNAERVAAWFKAGAQIEITGRLESMRLETSNGPVSVPTVNAVTVNVAYKAKNDKNKA